MLNSKTLIARRARKKVLAFSLPPSALACSGFTMVEIAICLAIIGIALVAIIGVLPLGINVQKDNRQESLIDQDATVFMENIRNGTRGLNDLTNYVFSITNYWTQYNNNGVVTGGGSNTYTHTAAFVYGASAPAMALTNGTIIIGLLSTPEYTDPNNGAPLPNLFTGGQSNHVVACVRSLSGPAVEKPPQNNDILRSDSFSYKIISQNVPVAVYTPPNWLDQTYKEGAQVFYDGISWRAIIAGNPPLPPQAGDEPPGTSSRWAAASYPQQLAANLRQLRLTFLWPLFSSGKIGNGRHAFATTVAGQVVQTNFDGYSLYFFQPQTFTAAP